MAVNTKAYIERHLKIKDKKARLIPLKLNSPQMKLYNALAKQSREGRPQRAIVLKARQMGFSTLVEALIFKRTATSANVNSGIVAHEISATNNLFRMSKRYYDNLPRELQPELKASNAKEIIFDAPEGAGLGSSIKCMTAGNDSIGRSDTFQNLHISELAFWKGNKAETLLGLMQAVPNLPDTVVIIESTANGYDEFKELWDAAVAGENDFVPVFCAWHELPEYSMPYNGFQLTEKEQKQKALYSLTNEQLAWRRWSIKNNCGGKEDMFQQEYPASPEEAFMMSGRPVFDQEKVTNRIAELKNIYADNSYKEGYFSFQWHNPDSRDYIMDNSIHFVEDRRRSDIRIYEEAQEGFPYVIGGDTKGEGSDYYAGTVINNNTGKRAASLHMQLMESTGYTWQMYCLGRYYSNALVGVEMNFNTAPIEELSRLKYPNQYVRQKYDDYTKQLEKKLGWKTDGNTRPLIIDKEIGLVNDSIELFTDIQTLQEMLTFVYDKNGRPDAISGKHDDLILSDMIAGEIRGQQRHTLKADTAKRNHWAEDMLEDYNNASAETRKYLEEKWRKK